LFIIDAQRGRGEMDVTQEPMTQDLSEKTGLKRVEILWPTCLHETTSVVMQDKDDRIKHRYLHPPPSRLPARYESAVFSMGVFTLGLHCTYMQDVEYQ
jgi:hypothetical protein